MHPILFTLPENIPLIGGKSLHLYGVMIALGFFLGMIYIQKETQRVGQNSQKMMDLFFGLIIAGLLGSRVLFIINEQWSAFLTDPLLFFRVWEGGLVFQGGVIFGVLYTVWFCYKHQFKFFSVADTFAPALVLGHAIGRVGCLFAGCCHGKQCDVNFPLAVVFPPHEHSAAPTGIPLYPTQIFESVGDVIIFLVLLSLRRHKKFDGAIFALYLILYSLLRFSLEFLRGDVVRGFFMNTSLSYAQMISIVACFAGIGLWVVLSKQSQLKVKVKYEQKTKK